MQSFIVTLLVCSVTMSALALLYMTVTPFLANRYSEKGRYYTWLIIVLGLIIPFRPQWGNAIVTLVTGDAAVSVVSIPMTAPVDNAVRYSTLLNISWQKVVTAVWLAGMFIFIVCHLMKHYRFVRMARRWSRNITDEQILSLFQNLKVEMGITKRIELYLCSCVGSPLMIGIVRPRILLPAAQFAYDELRFIFKHELVHHRRMDLLYKYLVLAAAAVHWFNPIVWLMARAIDVSCEMSCDAEVMRNADTDARRHYAETIIDVVKCQSKLKTALSTNFYGGKKSMKRRIFSIMDSGKKKSGIAIVLCAFVLTMGIGMAYAQDTASARETVYFDLEEEIRQTYARIERERAERDAANRASFAQFFAAYAQYGLTYRIDTNRLYYNGELVRYFEDNQARDGTFRGTVFPNADGNIDVHAVRDSVGRLIGVTLYSRAEFEARTRRIQNENGNVSVSGRRP